MAPLAKIQPQCASAAIRAATSRMLGIMSNVGVPVAVI
jgi:hypothetical protein